MAIEWPLSDARKRTLSRGAQFGVVVVLVLGLVESNISVVINGIGALAVTFLPAILSRDYRITLSPGLTLWLTLAVLLHAVGILGPYHAIWWWDHVTHTLSATVIAGLGYSTAHAIDLYSDEIYLPSRFLFVYILLFTVAFGVGWEVIEFVARALAESMGYGPVLVQYGLEDTIMDLIFDLIGGVLVASFGTPAFAHVVDSIVDRYERAAGEG